MRSLGLLKNLKIYQAFTFENKKITYAVISKNKNKIQYRRIDKHYKMYPKLSFAYYDKLYNPKHFMCQVYEHIGNVEVFDFLPF